MSENGFRNRGMWLATQRPERHLEQETPWCQNTSATHAKAAIRCWQASYMKLNIVSSRQSSAKFRVRKPKEWEQQVALSLE